MANMLIKISMLGLVYLAGLSQSSAGKQYKLRMLALWWLPRYPSCNATFQLVIDHVNKREDILPDYELIQVVRDQANINQKVVNFINEPLEQDTFLAPIVTGPTGDCNYIALTLKALGFTEVTFGCSGVLIWSRRNALYNNLYVTTLPQLRYVTAVVEIIEKLGHWKQISIFTSTYNGNNYMMAQALHSQAIKRGIDVLQVLDVYKTRDVTADSISSLKSARVIAVALISGFDCQNFLCAAYQAGVRPPYYSFIVTGEGCLYLSLAKEPVLPDNCTSEILNFQIKGAFFVGLVDELPETAMTTLGYSKSEFDEMFVSATANMTGLSIDYSSRYLCHDTILYAVLALHIAELELQSRFNMTLKDFADEPQLIRKVVDSTASKMSFNGLRIGALAVDENGEINEDVAIKQAVNGSATTIAKLAHLRSSNGSSFILKELQAIKWLTRSGGPPKDLSQIEQRLLDCGSPAVALVSTFAVIVSVVQILIFIINRIHKCKNELFNHPVKSASLLVFFLVANAFSMILVSGMDYFPEIPCRMWPVFPLLSLAGIHSFIFGQLLAYSKLIKVRLIRNIPAIFAISRKKYRLAIISKESIVENQTFISVILVSLPTLVFTSIWLSSKRSLLTIPISSVQFDEVMDTYFSFYTRICYSDNTWPILVVGVVYQFCLLITANCFSFSLMKHLQPPQFAYRCKLFRLAAANSLVLMSVFTLAYFLISRTNWPCSKPLVLSSGILLNSASTGIILMFPKQTAKKTIP